MNLLGTMTSVAATLILSSTGLAGEIVDVNIDRMFVPTGFDDNDQTQVVVDGLFPNSCYQIANGTFQTDMEARSIVLQAKAHYRPELVCLQVLVPFTHVFETGVLPQGDWTVRAEDQELTKALPVAEAASAGPDNELYAAIDNATVIYDDEVGSDVIVLEGRYTNTCMSWKEAKLVHATPDVIELLPIVQIDMIEDCEDIEFPFRNIKVPLPTLEKGRYLLHVRSMHGSAVNRVFNVLPEM